MSSHLFHFIILVIFDICIHVSALGEKKIISATLRQKEAERLQHTLWNTAKMMSSCLPKLLPRQKQTMVAFHHRAF